MTIPFRHKILIVTACLFFFFCYLLPAQTSLNMDLLSTWNGAGEEYNDIWGYADEAGREYAIIGSQSTTHFIDITNATNPVAVASIAGATTTFWRDFKTYRTYAYGVSEGSGSLQIFDLSNLPNQVTKVYDSTQFFGNCHNIFIDTQHGRLYAVGTSVADVVLLDLTANPAAPTLLRNIDLQGDYIHDIYVRDHIGYCSHEGRGLYVYDFSNPNSVVLKGTLTSYAQQGYNHSSWLSLDGKTLTMADENHGLAVKVVDVSDLTDIEVVTTFKSTLEGAPTANSIAHNPFIIGDQYVAVSYYHDGVQVYDISNPANPVKVAYYDTNTSHSGYGGFTGSWGVYPYLPSGKVIASDIINGLFVLQPTLACAFNQRIEGTIAGGSYAVAQDIISNGTIAPNSSVTFSAGRQIDLVPGFDSFLGSDFLAEITGCQGTTSFTPNAESHLAENKFGGMLNESSDKTEGIQVYPNPTPHQVTISIQHPTYLPSQLRVLSIDGSLLQEVSLSNETTNYQQDFSQFGEGMYILQFHTPERIVSKKVMVLKD